MASTESQPDRLPGLFAAASLRGANYTRKSLRRKSERLSSVGDAVGGAAVLKFMCFV
jgi:hypothetical protein